MTLQAPPCTLLERWRSIGVSKGTALAAKGIRMGGAQRVRRVMAARADARGLPWLRGHSSLQMHSQHIHDSRDMNIKAAGCKGHADA